MSGALSLTSTLHVYQLDIHCTFVFLFLSDAPVLTKEDTKGKYLGHYLYHHHQYPHHHYPPHPYHYSHPHYFCRQSHSQHHHRIIIIIRAMSPFRQNHSTKTK